MFFSVYDKDLTGQDIYLCESWSRIQRATDFDEMTVTGEYITQFDPFFVAVHDDQGKRIFSGLASTPVLDDDSQKTRIIMKDYRTLLNSEVMINWSKFQRNTVAEYLTFVFGQWQQNANPGLGTTFEIDIANIADLFLDEEVFKYRDDIENCRVSDVFFSACLYYDLYFLPEIDFSKKILTYRFFKVGTNTVAIKLEDFGITQLISSFGDYNRATVYTADKSPWEQWALTVNNKVVKLPANKDTLVYPAKYKNFVAEEASVTAINEAVYNAVMELAQNRYQDEIEFDSFQYKSLVDFEPLGFETMVQVYTQYDTSKPSKILPIGEINTDSTGKRMIKLGYRVSELTQVI